MGLQSGSVAIHREKMSNRRMSIKSNNKTLAGNGYVRFVFQEDRELARRSKQNRARGGTYHPRSIRLRPTPSLAYAETEHKLSRTRESRSHLDLTANLTPTHGELRTHKGTTGVLKSIYEKIEIQWGAVEHVPVRFRKPLLYPPELQGHESGAVHG